MKVEKVDISRQMAVELIPVRDNHSYKGDFGRVLLIGGNENMGGAIQMAAAACVNSGAGLTTVATAAVNRGAIHSHLPEAMVVDWHHQHDLEQAITAAEIILIGPGMGRQTEFWQHLVNLLPNKASSSAVLIFDGDAITMLAPELSTYLAQFAGSQIILTPHLGEWQRLCQRKIDTHDHDAIQTWVSDNQLHLVLKGERSAIYLPNQSYYYQNTGGNPGMAIGGSGDTLAGMVAGMLGQTKAIESALVLAVFMHSYIGDALFQDNYVVLPSQLAQKIPSTMKQLVKQKFNG